MFKKFAIIVLFISTFSILYSQKTFEPLVDEKSEKLNFYDIEKKKLEEYKNLPREEQRGWKQWGRWEYFWRMRTYPSGEFPNALNLFNEKNNYIKTYNDKYNNQLQASTWQLVGPVNLPSSNDGMTGIGRVNAVRIHPKRNNEIWVASASGGVWKSTDAGKSWNSFDFTQFLSLGASDIAFSPSNPDIVYVSTGDLDGAAGSKDFFSIGIIKTTDAGSTWTVTGFNKLMSDKKLVGKLLVNPTNPDIVLAATNDGIYKTTDGGINWTRKEISGFFVDMEFHPTNPNICYASTLSWGGNGIIAKSSDGGETWKKVLSSSNTVRIAIAVSPGEPDNVYALVANRSYTFNCFQMSYDAGETWEIASSSTTVGNLLGYNNAASTDTKGQGQYDLCLAVSPSNPSLIFIGGVNIWKSNDYGTTWALNAHWWGGYQKPYVHADHHDLIFSNDGYLYNGNDGGIVRTNNLGASWENLGNGLNITQFYKIGVSQKNPNFYIAGAQDNGTKRYKDGTWNKVKGGDGMDCAIDPNDDKVVYASIYNGDFDRSLDGGSNYSNMISESVTKESGAWVTPLAIDPSNSKNVYVGFQNVWKSATQGTSGSFVKISNFGKMIYSLAVAPSNGNYIYAASLNELIGTSDGGTTWKSLMTSYSSAITNIAVDPNKPDRIFITKSGYNPGDKVWMINDGVTTNVSTNLPNVPVNCIVIQKNSPDRIYIGTDIGVMYSDYNSHNWLPFGSGMPSLCIMDLEIQESSQTLVAGSYGRGIWKAPLISCNLPLVEIEKVGNLQFCTGDSVVLRVKNNYPSYMWSNGATTKEIVVKETGIYSVSINNGSECISKSEAQFVERFQPDQISVIKDGNAYLCVNGTIKLTSTDGFSKYIWSNGDTTQKITISKPGKYSVMGISPNGCVLNSQEIEINLLPVPDKPMVTRHLDTLFASDASSYQWYYNGNRILGATNRIYVFTEDKLGEYTVKITDAFGCANTSDVYNATTGVNEELLKIYSVNISPNPSNGSFLMQLNLPEQTDIYYSINDLLGNKVIDGNDFGNPGLFSKMINLPNIAKGVYLLEIRLNHNKINQQIIVH